MSRDGSANFGKATQTRPTYVLVIPWELDQLGGVTQVVLNLYREIESAGEMRPLIMVGKWSAIRPIEMLSDGRRIVYMRPWSPSSESGSIVGLIKWILASPVVLRDLLRICRHHRVVVFNFHYPSLSAFPISLLRFLRLYRGALILSFHGLDLDAIRVAGHIERVLWKFVFDCTTAIIACSRTFATEVSQFTGKLRGRVYAIHNGVDIDDIKPNVDGKAVLPRALGDRPFILSVATFEDKKGLDVLLRAFAQIRGDNPGLALVLVGRSSHAESKLRTLANDLDAADDIFFCANTPHRHVGVFLQRAKVFCLPSRSEPFGIAILEAGVYRLPVVASRVGGIPEFIIDGKTGLLVEPDDVEGLACALNRVLFEAQLAADLGEELFQCVSIDLSWKRAYREYRALLPWRLRKDLLKSSCDQQAE